MGGQAFASAGADGAAVESPGVLSGNNVQVPVHVPVNLCGNTVDIIAALNPAFGNTCVNADELPGRPVPRPHGTPDDDCPPEPAPPIDECEGQAPRHDGEHAPVDVAATAKTVGGALSG
nr:chaplin [Streptomyces sp. SID3343]